MTLTTVLPEKTGIASILEKGADGAANLRIRFKFNLWPRDPATRDNGNWSPKYHIATGQSPVRYGHAYDAERKLFEIRSLTTAEYNKAKTVLKRNVETVYNNSIILLPPDNGLNDEDYKFFISNPNKAAHCKGSLDVVISDLHDFTGPTIEIVKIKEFEQSRSFRSHSFRIQTRDLYFSSTVYPEFQDELIFDLTVAHEIGHHVVGAHINAGAPGVNPNDDAEYGTNIHDRRSIMGAGNAITAYDAAPWIDRACEHTGAGAGKDWRFILRPELDRIAISEQQKRILSKK